MIHLDTVWDLDSVLSYLDSLVDYAVGEASLIAEVAGIILNHRPQEFVEISSIRVARAVPTFHYLSRRRTCSKVDPCNFPAFEHLSEPVSDCPITRDDLVNVVHMAPDSIESLFDNDSHKVPESIAKAIIKDIGHGREMVLNNKMRWIFHDGLVRRGIEFLT